MNLIGLILWVFMGYLAATTALDAGADPTLAVLVGCLVTSLLQRLYTVTGRWKSDATAQD
jgi:hypothetical protein